MTQNSNLRIPRLCRPGMPGVAVFCALIFAVGNVRSQSNDQAPAQQLRARIAGFWQAMQDADYDKAITFIQADSKKTFNRMPKSRVNKFQIENLKFNKDFTECDTVTIVTKPMAAMGAVFDWPLSNRWVFQDGDWYLQIPWGENENPMLEAFKQQAKVTELTQPTVAPVPPPAPQKSISDLVSATQRLVPDPTNPAAVHYGEKVTLHFLFKNTGKEPIRILSAHSDCHCTGVKKDEYPEVQPGKEGSLEAVLDTFGLPLGDIEKKLTVQFSDLSYPLAALIQIRNLPNYRVIPSRVDFGTVEMGKAVEQTVRVINDSGHPVRILSTGNSDPRLEVSSDKTSLPAGEELVFHLRYTPAVPGEFLDMITMLTDLQTESIVNIPIRGTVKK